MVANRTAMVLVLAIALTAPFGALQAEASLRSLAAIGSGADAGRQGDAGSKHFLMPANCPNGNCG
jgi:hypothetical protein